MIRKDLILVGSRLVIALVLMAHIPGASRAQSNEGVISIENSITDSIRAAYQNAERENRGEKPTIGRLILEGKYIPGPYTVVIKGETIEVNGVPAVYPKPPPPGFKHLVVDSNAIQLFRVDSALWANFHQWREQYGFGEARQRALDFLLAQPVVEYARMEGETSLIVKYRGKKWEEGVYLYSASVSADSSSRITVRQNLERSAERLRNWLKQGCLVIMVKGGSQSMTFCSHRGDIAFSILQEIVAGIRDPEKRYQAIRGIVSGKEWAREIAERFVPQDTTGD